ncbi:DUF4367 domain-containing protein [Paenibacillus sp. FA6]|uniref:DUF4367 domain-containing protein n=1 Tax=Paenibacillus sp. FA6 TaxID=3413029 RepID=UPI003F654FED
MNEHGQEEDLKKALQRIHYNIEIPDSTTSWMKVQKRLQKKKRRRQWKQRLKISAAIVAGSFIVSILVNTTTPTAYSQLASLFKRIQSDVVVIFHENPDQNPLGAKTVSPDDSKNGQASGGQMIETTLEEAIQIASFQLLVPSDIPQDFQMDIVRLFRSSEGEFNNIQMEYANTNGEIINIVERAIVGKAAAIKTEMALDSGNYKDVTIQGNAAILIIENEGNVSLEWLTQDRIRILITGSISEPDILKLANSLK